VKVKLVTCQNYYPLLKSVLSELTIEWVENQVLSCRCYFTNSAEKEFKQKKINELLGKKYKIKLLLPTPCCGLSFSEESTQCSYKKMYHCFEMILPEKQFDELVKQGNYLLTEPWLERWEYYLLNEWGFDQKTAIEFFKESASSLALLQINGNKTSHEKLKKFAEFVQLKYIIVPIDLDYFRTYVHSIIEEEKFK